MSLTKEEMVESVALSYNDNKDRLKDIVSERCHCNIAQPGSLNSSSGSASLCSVAMTIVRRCLQPSEIFVVSNQYVKY